MGSRGTIRALVVAAGLALGSHACGGKSPAPSVPPGAQQVNGSERLTWNQAAFSGDEVAGMRFAALVDGVKVALAGAACSASADAALYECSSRLPAMSPGAHSLQLIAINGVLESEPSTPALSVVLVAGSASGAASKDEDGRGPRTSERTTDGVTLAIETLAGGLADATDVAPAPGGQVFVAERAGRIRMVRDGALLPEPVAVLDGTLAGSGELVAIAADPAFGGNRFVYALAAVAAPPDSGRARDFRIIRLREAGGTLVDQVTLLAGVPAPPTRATAALRFGPDGRLYAAIDSGGDERAARDAASFNGKVLRLNADGTTPSDQAGATPVLAGSFPRPGGLGWARGGGILWVCDRRDDGGERLTPLVLEQRPVRARTRAAYNLPSPIGIGGALVYSSPAVPEFEGNLFVGAESARYLLRVRFDPADPLTVASTEQLLEGRVGGIRAVATDADGAIYVATDDTLLRLTTTKGSKSGSAGLRITR